MTYRREVEDIQSPRLGQTLLISQIHEDIRTISTLCVSMLALSFASACGSSGSTATVTTGASGSFNATITGASAGSYTGFGGAATQGGFTVISLGTTDTKFALAFTRSGARPAPGTYQLSDNLLTNFTAALNINNGTLYGSSSGTLTITSSSASEIRGSFDYQGKLNNGSTTNAVKGDFVAPCQLGC